MSMEITCQHWSGTLLGISFPTFCIGKVFIQLHASHPQQTWQHTWTALATSSSATPVPTSSNIWGVLQLWLHGAHAPVRDGAGGCPGHKPYLYTGQHLLCMSTHQSGVPPHLRPSRLSPLGCHTEHSIGSIP